MKRLDELKALMVALVIGVLFILYSTRERDLSKESSVNVAILTTDEKASVFTIPAKVLHAECTMFTVSFAVEQALQARSGLIVVVERMNMEYYSMATSFCLEGITKPVVFTVNNKESIEGAHIDLQKGLSPGVYRREGKNMYHATGTPFIKKNRVGSLKMSHLPLSDSITVTTRRLYPSFPITDLDVYSDVLFIITDGNVDNRVLEACEVVQKRSVNNGKNLLICFTDLAVPLTPTFPCLFTRHAFTLAYVKMLWLLSNAGSVDLPTLQKLLNEQSLRME